MQLTVEPKDVSDAYSTPIVQQTSFWSRVKANLGMRSKAFEFSVRNSGLYTDVGGWSRTNADLLMFAQYCSRDEYMAYLPYGPEIEPSEENQGRVAPKADPSHPMHGLYRFKTGFGGQMYHQMGCRDYPLDMDGYRQFAAREMSLPGYYA